MSDSDRCSSPVEHDSEEVNGPRPKHYRHGKGSNATSRSLRRPSDAGSTKHSRHHVVVAGPQDSAVRDIQQATETPVRRSTVIQSSSSHPTNSPFSTGGRTSSTYGTEYSQSSPIPETDSEPRRPPKQAAFVSQLSGFLKDFASIESGDYKECYSFAIKNPQIWKEDKRDFLRDAVAALVANKESHAKRCVQRAVMIQECTGSSSSDIKAFFEGLINKKKPRILEDFLKNCKDATARLKENLPLPVATTSERNATQDTYPIASVASMSIQGGHLRNPGEQRSPEQFLGSATRTHQAVTGSLQSGYSLNTGDQRFAGQLSGSTPRMHQDKFGPMSLQGSYPRNAVDQRPYDQFPVSTPRAHVDTPTHQDTNNPNSRNAAGRAPGPAGGGAGTGAGGRSDVPTVPDSDLPHMVETLDARYKIRNNSAGFFTFGRVFATPWHTALGTQQAGALRDSDLRDWVVSDCFGGSILTHIQRMVVVKEGHGFSWCILINTYQGRGVAKKGLNRDDRLAHAVIHMTGTSARTAPTERDMMEKNPIAVHPAATDQKLDIMSRVNFGKVHTIEHNVRVMDVGKISRDAMNDFKDYWDDHR